MIKPYYQNENSALYCCDNIDLMKTLPDNCIDLIYCDILYGTGKKFKDYQDLKCDRKIIEDHYIPRIKEMYRILKDTGSIYLQMDTRINHWIRCIMDDVFGRNRFKAEIAWRYHVGGRGKRNFSNKHDILLFYTKGKRYLLNLTKNKVLRTPEVVRRIESGVKNATFSKDLYRVLDDVWDDIQGLNNMAKERNKYETQKPKALIERIVKVSSNEGNLIADFYAGSFTTAEVCKDLNRKFIGCDINIKGVELGIKRLT